VARLHITASDIVSAALASLVLGVLVGAAICLALLGFGWWANIPSEGRWQWAYIPATVFGCCMSIYMFWQFVSGKLLPIEIWERIRGFFDGVNDVSD
jgi:hypothetical protein